MADCIFFVCYSFRRRGPALPFGVLIGPHFTSLRVQHISSECERILAKFFGGSIESCVVSPGYGYPRTCGNEQSRGSQAYAAIATRNQGSLTFKFHVWCNDRV